MEGMAWVYPQYCQAAHSVCVPSSNVITVQFCKVCVLQVQAELQAHSAIRLHLKAHELWKIAWPFLHML